MGEFVKQILAKPIQLAEQVTKAADEVNSFKQECGDLKSITEQLAALLRRFSATRVSFDSWERPTRRIIEETEQVLFEALSLVLKCCVNTLMKRVLTIIHNAAFGKVSSCLVKSIGNVSWLLSVSAPASYHSDEYLRLPPIAANEPILCDIWEQIAILHAGSPEDRSHAAAFLYTLARDDDRYGKLVMEEGGVSPLLKLLSEGNVEGQKNATRAIGLLGRDPERVEHLIHLGVCTVFAKILQEGSMEVQSVVAWAVSELAASYPKIQDIFAQYNIVRLLVDHLAFETIDKNSKYAIVSMKPVTPFIKYLTKVSMKQMAARALGLLAKDNSPICRVIAESGALLCFAVLLETGPEAVQYNSAMAVMEITAMAEKDADFREFAFQSNSPACKAIVDIVHKIIEQANTEPLIPCIKSIGNLAKAVTDMRIIDSLVRLFNKGKVEVTKEALIALTKYACTENSLHVDFSKAIVSAGATKHLTVFVYFGEHVFQIPAMVLLSYIVLHVPQSEEFLRPNVLGALKWASMQSFMIQDEVTAELLLESMNRLELYQSERIL